MSQQTLKAGHISLDDAVALHKAGRLKEAEDSYLSVIAENPREEGALYRLGVLCMQGGRMDEAIGYLQRAIASDPSNPDFYNVLAATYQKMGDGKAAAKVCREALAAHPDHSILHTNYAMILTREGNTGAAEKHLNEALRCDPENVEAMNSLGLIHYNKLQQSKALPLFEQAVALKPDFYSAWFNLGEALKASCRYTEASEAYRRLTELEPKLPLGWVNYATMLIMHNQIEEALDCFWKSIEINPREAISYMQINYLLQGMSRHEEIPALIAQAKTHLPGTSIAAYIEGQYLRRNKEYQKALELLLPHASGDDVVARKIHFELGAIYDKLDEPEKAFYHCTQGNRLSSVTIEAQSIDRESIFRNIDYYKAATTKAQLAKWTKPVENRNYPTPAFIVGFPRSGTTLLDQILSAHPGIFVSAERESFAPVTKLLRGKVKLLTEKIPDLMPEDIESLRTLYFDIHKSYGDWKDREVFIDKLPFNINILNLVYRMFPEAKVITALRHPCDCVLSNYMYDFSPNYAMIHTNDIKSCARLYARTMELYEQYKEVLPLKFHELRYEDVVKDLRGEAEKVLSFLGLPWNESVMEYSKAANEGKFISTPSAGQVNQKIYTSASQRWLKYRDQLAPVLPILEPWVKKFGYEMG